VQEAGISLNWMSPQQALFGAPGIHAAVSAPPKGQRRTGMCTPNTS
jgi:hypothetical protein